MTDVYSPSLIYKTLMSTGSDWADKKAAYMLLDDMTKTVLADITSRKEAKSMAEREQMSRADSMYKAHLQALGEARRVYLQAQVKYESAKALAEGKKTEAIAGMAEKKYIGMGEG